MARFLLPLVAQFRDHGPAGAQVAGHGEETRGDVVLVGDIAGIDAGLDALQLVIQLAEVIAYRRIVQRVGRHLERVHRIAVGPAGVACAEADTQALQRIEGQGVVEPGGRQLCRDLVQVLALGAAVALGHGHIAIGIGRGELERFGHGRHDFELDALRAGLAGLDAVAEVFRVGGQSVLLAQVVGR